MVYGIVQYWTRNFQCVPDILHVSYCYYTQKMCIYSTVTSLKNVPMITAVVNKFYVGFHCLAAITGIILQKVHLYCQMNLLISHFPKLAQYEFLYFSKSAQLRR